MKFTLNEKNTKLTVNHLNQDFEFSVSELKKDENFKNDGSIALYLTDNVSISLSRDSFLENICHHDASERGHPDDYENEKTIYKLYCLLEGWDMDEVEEGIENLEKQKAILKAKKKEEIDQITAERVLKSLTKERAECENALIDLKNKIRDAERSMEASDDPKEKGMYKSVIEGLEKEKKVVQMKADWIKEEYPKQKDLHESLGVHPTGELSFTLSREVKKMLVGVRDEKKPGITLKNVTPAMIKKEYTDNELLLKLL